MYTDRDFDVFSDPTLAGRLAAIRQEIDPKFEQTAQDLGPVFAAFSQPLVTHVAQHRRRYKNPPENTWVAFSTNPRGYKMMPHLEIGFWNDRFFIWLAVLAEAKQRASLVQWLCQHPEVASGQRVAHVSDNHMAKHLQPADAPTYQWLLDRLTQSRQADWLIGQTWLRGDPFFALDEEQQRTAIQGVVRQLLPTLARLQDLPDRINS